MQFTQNHLEELNILIRFNLTTTQEGIKVHKTAPIEVIEACHRLFKKGLITLDDGGYLTTIGHEASEQAHLLLGLLTPAD